MNQLRIGDEIINYQIVNSLRAKNISLKISHDAHLKIVLPKGVSLDRGLRFVSAKSKWILKHYNRIRRHQSIQQTQNPNKIMVFGEPAYELAIKRTKSQHQKWAIKNSKDVGPKELLIKLGGNSNTDLNKYVQLCIADFYKKLAQEYIPERVSFFCDQIGVKFNKIRFKDTKTRWGSCSSKKNLNFNYRIMMAPVEIIDYLIAHEVAHLREMNHSEDFWKIVSELDPNYLSHKKWLKTNGSKLQTEGILSLDFIKTYQ